jgi:hypothetical protein
MEVSDDDYSQGDIPQVNWRYRETSVKVIQIFIILNIRTAKVTVFRRKASTKAQHLSTL